jgi:hypothetical protein
MKPILMGLGLIILTLCLAIPNTYAQPQPYQGGWGCPPLRQAPATQQGGWGNYQGGWALGAPNDTSQQPQTKPLTQDEAKSLLEKSLNNPNLKVGDISDKGATYEANIVTKEGSLVDKVQIDKNTGWFRSIY